jgi:hypothetical protein
MTLSRLLPLLFSAAILLAPGLARAANTPPAAPSRAGAAIIAQRHSLTCEAAATASAARTAGWNDLAEEQINRVIPRAWNPREGFVGNPDGWQSARLAVLQSDPSSGYGAEASALQLALRSLAIESFVLEGREFSETVNVLQRLSEQGFGVVIWGTSSPWRSWGRYLEPYRFVEAEHAYEFLGLHTSPEGWVDGARVGDPASGRVYLLEVGYVRQMMALFDNMALVVVPPAGAAPATGG